MKIGMQTWGSDGDIRPMIALAGGLRAAGHEVSLGISSVDNKRYTDFCERLDVPCIQAPEHFDCDLENLGRILLKKRIPAFQFKGLLDAIYVPLIPVLAEVSDRICQGAHVVIGHLAVHTLAVAAQERGIPRVSVTYWPGLIPSTTRPPATMPDWGKTATRFQWWLVRRLVEFALGKQARKLYRQRGLPAPRDLVDDIWHSHELSFLAASPALIPPPPDWKGRHEVTGFFNMPQEFEPWEPLPELARFLDSGEPPVYMTFGSAGQCAPERATQLLVDTARFTRCRAIIQMIGDDRRAGSIDESGSIFFAPRLPHQHVFPRCRAVVHSGGAGITQTTLRHGLPAVIAGFAAEQVSWAHFVHQAGCGGKPQAFQKTSAGKLASELKFVLGDSKTRRSAEELGKKMQREDGVGRAVKLLEERFERGSHRTHPTPPV